MERKELVLGVSIVERRRLAFVGAVGLLVPISGIRTHHYGNSLEPPEPAVPSWPRKAVGLFSL